MTIDCGRSRTQITGIGRGLSNIVTFRYAAAVYYSRRKTSRRGPLQQPDLYGTGDPCETWKDSNTRRTNSSVMLHLVQYTCSGVVNHVCPMLSPRNLSRGWVSLGSCTYECILFK
jgi:hypothetical protein